MWWRNPIRIAAVIALGALNAACFQPLYASRSVAGGTPLGTQLAQVEVERVDAPNGTPESRIAVELQEALNFEMNGGGGLISPTHRAQGAHDGRPFVDHHRHHDRPRRWRKSPASMRSFTLTELATGKAVMNGRTFARVSSDYPGQQQRFARTRARLDAENRAAKVIAENVRTRVASFFVAGS